MIHITDSAAIQMKELVAAKSGCADAGLRLWVERGGCAGMSYEMAVREPEPGDLVYSHNDAKLFVPPDALPYLDGSTLDYEGGLSGAGFRIHNPRATRSCGCGTSFEPTQEPQPAAAS